MPDIDACAAVAEKIVASLRRPIVVDGDELTVTASVGIAVSAGLDAYDTLLRRADVAMYGAKSAGRDTMVAADEPVEDRRVPTHC